MPDHRPPSAPPPHVLARLLDDIAAEIDPLRSEYGWLHPSASHRSRRETGERTRRAVSGAGGDVSDTLSALRPIRSHLDRAADNVRRARDLLAGARHELGRASTAIDASQRAPVDAAPASVDDAVDMPKLRAARDRRLARQRNSAVVEPVETVTDPETGIVTALPRSGLSGTPWASEEITG